MGLHVLQQVVVELELDPTGTAGVGLWGETGSVRGRTPPGACCGDPDTHWVRCSGPWAQPVCSPALAVRSGWGHGCEGEEDMQLETMGPGGAVFIECLLRAGHCSGHLGGAWEDHIRGPRAL